jgi:hypothetical protein
MVKCFVGLWLVLLIGVAQGCSPAYFQPRQPGNDYRLEIEDWQERIRQEGWHEALVNDIMAKCIRLSKYETDPDATDYWMTYREFIQSFRGDCEDIATFMYGTLKRLNYPEAVRLRALRMPLGDHVVVMVKLPGGRWKMFNSVPMPGDVIDIAFSRTLVEWDEENIYYPSQQLANR